MDFDVVIAGAGYVGCAAALGLSSLGLSVCMLDNKPFATTVTDAWDLRVFTLSPGSQRLLQRVGVWQELDPSRVADLFRMEIYGDNANGHMTFDAMQAGVERLASVVEGSRLQVALENAVRRSRVDVIAPVEIAEVEWGRAAVHVHLADGRRIGCRLLLAADGADSQIRARASIEVDYRSYGEMGVVASLRGAKPHRGRAFQWFRHDSVLAFLPLPERDFSIVWSTGAEHAVQLQAQGARAFSATVEAAAGSVLGPLELTSAVRAFPLRYVRANRAIGARVALMGDAAHTVHPLAGQGVNLGFRDVETLIRVLKERPASVDVGATEGLYRYQRMRTQDTMAVFALTDGLHKLFANSNPMVRMLRNEGMHWLDGIQSIKRALVRRAMR